MNFNSLLKNIDKLVIPFMHRSGHKTERVLLAIVFIWFGMLKIVGAKSATSIVAKTVYIFDPTYIVPLLGLWEILIGITLLNKRFLRIAILLLFIRLPGTFFALIYNYSVCFTDSIFIPTIQGQYLLKEITLVGVALVIGSTIKRKV